MAVLSPLKQDMLFIASMMFICQLRTGISMSDSNLFTMLGNILGLFGYQEKIKMMALNSFSILSTGVSIFLNK